MSTKFHKFTKGKRSTRGHIAVSAPVAIVGRSSTIAAFDGAEAGVMGTQTRVTALVQVVAGRFR